MFRLKPDYEKSLSRMNAFWECEVLDRPVTIFNLDKPTNEQMPLPTSHHISSEERWLDTQYQVELAVAYLHNQYFLGDTMPVTFPNLGPEILSAIYGCQIHFGDYGTSWTDPILDDWSQVDKIKFDWNSPYLKKLIEMTDALLEAGKDTFITGMTDWHPGGDCIAAFRDPQNLAIDMLTEKEQIIKLIDRISKDYFTIYDYFYGKLRLAGLPITAWLPLVSDSKYYIPSNDFSIMISKKMYDDVFLPGIIEECRFYDRSIYHLDGPGALRHLDSILGIQELNALQFVPGAGNEGFSRWVPVYQKAQSLHKGIQVFCNLDELPLVMETLNPKGLFLQIFGMPDRETAENVLLTLKKWTSEKRRNQ